MSRNTSMRVCGWAVLVIALSGGCSDPKGGPDAGASPDAGRSDTGTAGDGGTSADIGQADATFGGRFLCQELCDDDSDCTIGAADTGARCDRGRCRQQEPACVNDQQCVADNSNWASTSCASDSDCAGVDPAARCVDLDGAGPGTTGGCAEDAADGCRFRVEMTAVAIDGSQIQVCGTRYQCDGASGECERAPCRDDSDCANLFDICDVATGRCTQCSTDADCADFPMSKCYPNGLCGCADDSECERGLTHCRSDGFCGCASDAECQGSPLGDLCDPTNHVCGCGGDVASCGGNPVYDGTQYICQEY